MILLRILCPSLLQAAPTPGGGEEGFEVFLLPAWGKTEPTSRPVVNKAGQSNQASPARQSAGIMIAAFDFIPRIMPLAVVAVVDAANDAQAFADHAFIKQMRGQLTLATRPNFVSIEDRLLHSAAFGPGANEQPRLAGPGKPALRRIGLVLGGHVRRPIISVDGLESGSYFVQRINRAEVKLISPILTKQLIGQATVAVLKFRRLLQRNFLNEVFPVPKVGDRPLTSLGSDRSTFRGELRIALQVGHLGRRQKCGQIQTAHERVGPDEVQIIGVPLLVLDNAV